MAKHKRPVRIHRVDDGGDDDNNADDDAVEPTGSGNTLEYYISMLNDYDETQFTRKTYSDASERLQGLIERLWYR